MFPSFISILDIQSWWEVPSIAHFCSLFRAAFNLLDFDIEELEEALLTDGTEDSGSSLLQELIVRLLCGCLANNDVSTFNYQMFLRRLFRQKCQEHGRYNPFNTDIDFQFLPLRTKVEILHALCDFRLDADDVLDLLKNLEAESLRVEPLGYDDNDSAYWYFYGTRLYREDYEKGSKKSKHKKSVWQVVCFTEQDWNHLTSKFKGATSKTEKALYRSLSENFLPEIPRLFQEKERQQRKRLLELQPRRSSSRVQKLRAQHEEENKTTPTENVSIAEDEKPLTQIVTPSARELRAIQRDAYKSGSGSGSESESRAESPTSIMPTQKSNNSGLTSVGRQTNNSLASATGQILIQTSSQRKKLKTSQVFRQTEEDLQTGMYKILEYVKNHDDAWPFIEPVEEDYAPNYYSVVRKPMDLQRMEDKLDAGEYLTFSRFKADFQLIVDNCRLYNGSDNEYTEMVDNLQQAFQRATDRFLDQITSSDEEIAVEFQGSSKENVTNNKKGKRGRKENKIPNKRSSSPNVEEKPSKMIRGRHNKLKNSPLLTNEVSKKVKPTKKEKNHKDKEKDKVKDKNTVLNANGNNSRKYNKRKSSRNTTSVRDKSRSRTRSRSRSNMRGWTSSPSPPPPRIQKKKKNKEKIIEPPTVDNNIEENIDKYEFKEVKTSESKIQKNFFNTINENIKKNNSQLNETIEKLKKNNSIKKEHISSKKQKIRDKNKERIEKLKENKIAKKSDSEIETESTNNIKDSPTLNEKKVIPKKVKKAGIIKNPAAIKALDLATEQTLKDINKWLDDTPKFSELSSPSNSPLPLSNLDEFDVAASNLETEYKLSQQKIQQKQTTTTTTAVTSTTPSFLPVKTKEQAKDSFNKRRSVHKDIYKLQKRKDFQRTIDRLQPGKSKGNLIANIQSSKVEDSTFPPITLNKLKETKNSTPTDKQAETTPKLSLGTVLDSFGQQHNFVDNKKESESIKVEVTEDELVKENINVEAETKSTEEYLKSDNETPEVEDKPVIKLPKQENVTPNLSAWFKAFGAPKSSTVQKKKNDSELDVSKEAENVVSPISADERLPKPNCELAEESKKMSSPMPSPAPDIAVGLQQPVPRMRKASTGSTVSERSSFSQDMTDPLDSPRLSVDERLGMYSAPYPSPLHRSPMGASPVMASPQMDDGQRTGTSYPPLNGNIRVGFYQDTVKSSPEKSCSPRDQPHSPHPQYSQHVYIPPSSSNYQYSNPPSVSNPSPAQSPIYSQPSGALPLAYNSFFESNKPPEYETVKSPCSSNNNNNNIQTTLVKSPDSPKQFENSNNSQSPRIIENKLHMNPIIPVKKRLYNENPDIEQISRISSPHVPLHRDLNIQNIPRVHEMNIFNNREMDCNLMPTQHINLNSEQLNIPSNKSFLPAHSQALETSISSAVKNYNLPTNTLCDISNRTLDNTHVIDVTNRGLNLQIPNTESLNIPNTVKTIDLTGPDSPVYNQQSAMNMPLDIGTIKHNSRNSDNIYQKVSSNAPPSNLEMAQLSQYHRHDSEKSLLPSKVHNSISQAESVLSVNSTIAYNNRSLSIDLNAHNARINLASADLRIPTIRTETVPQNLNQEINNPVPQRNEFSHKNLRNTENRIIPTGINIELTNSPVTNSHAFNNASATMNLDPSSLSLRGNLANLSHIVDRYQNDERILTTLTAPGNPYYTDKNLVAAQSLFPKAIPTSIHTPPPPISNSTSSTHPVLSQPNLNISTPSSTSYVTSTQHQQTVKSSNTAASIHQVADKKLKKRKSKTSSPVTNVTETNSSFQTYGGLKSSAGNVVSSEPSAISLKTTSVVPGSAFNFGPAPTTLGLSSAIYNDKDNFTGFLDEYRNPTTNYYMAAAAAAGHHRSTPDLNTDKSQRSIPPSTNPAPRSFTYLGHPQTRPTTYSPFMNPHQPPLMETSSPLYQQYLQRQEELLRHSGVLHQSLLGPPPAYTPGYPPLSMRQPFDTMNRPSWL